MTVYNITTKVQWSIAEQWLGWQQREHIPAIMQTGLFENYKIYRLTEQDDSEGPTFIIQYFTLSPDNCRRYVEVFAPTFRRQATDKWGDEFVAFRTIMESVQ